MEDEIAQDGVVAQDETQSKSIWGVREGLTEALGKEGAVYKYDISMPVSKINDCVLDMRDHLEKGGVFGKHDSPVIDVVGYGHVGDGNLHLNIPARQADSRVMELIEPYLFEWVGKCTFLLFLFRVFMHPHAHVSFLFLFLHFSQPSKKVPSAPSTALVCPRTNTFPTPNRTA